MQIFDLGNKNYEQLLITNKRRAVTKNIILKFFFNYIFLVFFFKFLNIVCLDWSQKSHSFYKEKTTNF